MKLLKHLKCDFILLLTDENTPLVTARSLPLILLRSDTIDNVDCRRYCCGIAVCRVWVIGSHLQKLEAFEAMRLRVFNRDI